MARIKSRTLTGVFAAGLAVPLIGFVLATGPAGPAQAGATRAANAVIETPLVGEGLLTEVSSRRTGMRAKARRPMPRRYATRHRNYQRGYRGGRYHRNYVYGQGYRYRSGSPGRLYRNVLSTGRGYGYRRGGALVIHVGPGGGEAPVSSQQMMPGSDGMVETGFCAKDTYCTIRLGPYTSSPKIITLNTSGADIGVDPRAIDDSVDK